MTGPVRQAAENVTVFSIGGTDYVGDFENATVTREVKDEDASGARDIDEYAWAVKRRTQIEADLFVTGVAGLVLITGNSVTVNYTAGGTNYSGQFLVTQGVHTLNKAALQKQRVVMKGQGVITAAAAGP